MKTLLLLMLMASAAQADQWMVKGVSYKGTIHRFSADLKTVFVTSDWDNYSGSWLKVADLDAATRVRLGVATPQEQSAVKAAEVAAATEVRAQSAENAAYESRLSARLAEGATARRMAQTAEYERQMLALRQREIRASETQARVVNRVIQSSSYYSPYSQYGTSYYRVLRNPYVPYVPSVPYVPAVPCVPQVYGVPILLWTN